jgi:hypothetical protein
MSCKAEFNRILGILYAHRTDTLRRILGFEQKSPRTLTKRQRERKIVELQIAGSNALAKRLARHEFPKAVTETRNGVQMGLRRPQTRLSATHSSR